jgi:hypothetical protein
MDTVLISDESRAILALLQQAENEARLLNKLQDEVRDLRKAYEAQLNELSMRMSEIESRKADLEETAIAIYHGRAK